MRPVYPFACNHTREELRIAMDAAPTKEEYIRIQAILMMLTGIKRSDVVSTLPITSRTLNRWISKYNQAGVDGLINRPRLGRPPLITGETEEKVVELLNNPAQVGVFHWTIRHLHGFLKEEIDLQCSYQTLLRTVHKKKYVLRVPRPQPTEQDEVARTVFKEKLEAWQQEPELEIWFIDETGIEGDPRPRRRWVPKGSSPKIDYSGQHIRETLIGAVCSKSKEFIGLQMPWCDTDIFQIFIDHLSEKLSGRNVLLIMDNATWHRAKKLNWHNLRHDYLPPYSPDYNPIERLWLVMKARYFADWIAKSPEDLSDRITHAVQDIISQPELIKSVCRLSDNYSEL